MRNKAFRWGRFCAILLPVSVAGIDDYEDENSSNLRLKLTMSLVCRTKPNKFSHQHKESRRT